MKKRRNVTRPQKDDEVQHDAVSVVVEPLDLHPHCVHGPTILFKRVSDKAGGGREFFACSASRDRSGCSFFLWKDQKLSAAKRVEWRKRQETWVKEKTSFFQCASGKNGGKKCFCLECQVVFEHKVSAHQGHQVREIDPADLARPTRILYALNSNKREAQYHFSESSVATILAAARSNGKTHLLCIGTPTLHEATRASSSSSGLHSLLMDIDHRLGQFDGPFVFYNMFNHFMFLQSQRKSYDTFLKEAGTGLLVITDPPFGGKCELIGETLRKIEAEWRALNGFQLDEHELSVMWIYPYFMETTITSVLPSLVMCDYKLNYTNHPKFREGSLSRGSPVRFFTNLPLEKVCLPEAEGYRLCPKCKKYVSEKNKHCDVCSTCPSKNGEEYKHCLLCKKCFKGKYFHCSNCMRCALKNHPCQLFQAKAVLQPPNKKRKFASKLPAKVHISSK